MYLLVRFALFALLCTGVSSLAAAEPEPPNVVILFCDDAGYGDFGFAGHPTIATPHLDRMVGEGTRLTQFYSASPACTASRYGLLTGRHPNRSGFSWVLGPNSKIGLHPREVTLAETLKAQGYATACYGKWHLGIGRKGLAGINEDHSFLPLQNGFDEYYGIPYSNDMRPCVLIENNKVASRKVDQSTLTREYTERTIAFIEKNRQQRFFVYLPYAMPHVPLFPGKAHRGKSLRGLYGDVIEEIDWSVGAILTALREKKLAEKTLVVFTSDNGPWLIKKRRGGSSGLFRDGKGSTWEGGMREPGVFWWPGTIPAGKTRQEIASTWDLLPTITLLAGGKVPNDRTLDGKDIRDVLLGRGPPTITKPIFFGGPGASTIQAVRVGPWKLHIKTNSQLRLHHGWPNVSRENPLLFHLEHDPSETINLAKRESETVAKLLKVIDQFNAGREKEGTFWDK